MSNTSGSTTAGQAALRSDEAYAHAILDAALDAVITIDHRGHVLEFNRAAEQTFDRRREDVLGRELAELIVPLEQREAHRRALARWSEDGPSAGAGGLLGRRIEVDAMRADGSLFPSELAISRVDVPGAPVFTACIRDVSDRKIAEERLLATEIRYRTLVEQLPLISYVDSSESAVSKPLYLSPQIESVLGRTPEEWVATPHLYEESIHEDDRERVLALKQASYEKAEALRLEYRMIAADGRVVWVEDRSVHVEPPEGDVFRQGFAIDITERKNAEEALRRAESRFRALVEQLPLAVYIDRLDENSSNVYSSPQIEPMLGYSPEEWTSNPSLFVEALHPEDRERVLEAHAVTLATGEPLRIEYRLRARDGRTVSVHDEGCIVGDRESGEALVMQGYLQDITGRMEAEEQLRHQAFHDALTGLANRALFTDRVQHALVIRAEEQPDLAVLFLDLDDFKAVNDSLGHVGGDTLLRAVGERFRLALSPSQTVARIGGDEFAILVEEGSGLPTAVDVAERVLAQLQEPFGLEEREVFVSASIGIAVSADAEELLRSANVAMYQAKSGGGGQYVVYAPRMDKDVEGRMELVAELRRACVAEEFVLHYQPAVELATGAIVGVEALIRWRHPRLGLLQPSAFIPLAEETGRIVDIGRWVLAEACRQAAAWRELPGAADLTMSVNVSTRQVRRVGLLEDVAQALDTSGLDPAALTLEITETVLAGARAEMVSLLGEIEELGVSLALDDFGTGYSSLSLLQDLPVQTLKIDRSFVGAIGTGMERIAFVRAIVDLAEALGLKVIGEGIETAAHVATLLRLGCRIGQGFYYAEPLEARALDGLFAAGVAPRLPGRRAAAA